MANVTQKGVNSAFIKVCFQWWINTYFGALVYRVYRAADTICGNDSK